MQKFKIIDNLLLKSGAAGAEAPTQITRVVDALGSKSGSLYLVTGLLRNDPGGAIAAQHQNWCRRSDYASQHVCTPSS